MEYRKKGQSASPEEEYQVKSGSKTLTYKRKEPSVSPPKEDAPDADEPEEVGDEEEYGDEGEEYYNEEEEDTAAMTRKKSDDETSDLLR